MAPLENLSLARKMLILPLVGALLFSAFFFFHALPLFEDSMMANRSHANRQLVETAVSAVHAAALHAERQGLNTNEAQALARDVLGAMRYDEDNYFFVLNEAGVMLLHPLNPDLEGQNLRDTTDAEGVFLTRRMLQAAAEGEGAVRYLWPHPNGGEPAPKITYVKQFEPWGWIVASGLYVDDVNAMVEDLALEAALGLLIAILALFAAAHVITRRITAPLRQAQRALDRLAEGDLDVTLPGDGLDATTNAVHTRHDDEVGQMLAAMRRMVRAHHALAEQARRLADKDLRHEIIPRSEADVLGRALADLSRALRNQLDEFSRGVDVIAQTTGSLGGSTHSLAIATGETAASVAETVTTMRQVAQSAASGAAQVEGMAKSARDVLDVASAGLEATRRNAEEMQRVLDHMESLQHKADALTEKTQRIHLIIDSVADLADRSQILAVNAAIEAAKAGEAGAGFEEVAVEMRRLAVASKQATTDISSILLDIDDSVKASGKATRASAAKVAEASVHLMQAEQAIHALTDNLEHAAETAASLASNQDQEKEGLEQIASAMSMIRAASDKSAAVAERMTSEAESLEQLGRRLEAIVAPYKT